MRNKALVTIGLRSVKAVLFLAVLLCGVYPLVVMGLAKTIFPHEAGGSLVTRSGEVTGSELIAQPFTAAGYFHPRPSATAETEYDASASGGSNLGPLSEKLMDQVRERIRAYRLENDLEPEIPIPADAVTASGSGLDPDISVANANLQAARVAHARAVPVETVLALIDHLEEGPLPGFPGIPRVNVLRINLALNTLGSEVAPGTRLDAPPSTPGGATENKGVAGSEAALRESSEPGAFGGAPAAEGRMARGATGGPFDGR